MTRNIVFDFGCVLADLNKQRCVEAFNNIGAKNISHYVDECRQEDLFHDLEVGNIGISKFCDEVRRKSPGCTATNEQICQAWNMLLTGIPVHRIEKLVELRSKYRLFLLSNTNIIHWSKAVDEFFPYMGMNVNDYFEKLFLSYEMHKVKPDREIFMQMLHDAGIAARETLFIDDSAANCRGAEAVGISTIHVTSGNEWIDKVNILYSK